VTGRAIVAGLLRESFVVYLGARDPSRGASAATDLASLGDVRFVQLDVTSDESVDHIPTPSEETAADLRFVYETNVFAVVRMTNAFLPLLRRSPAGRIVNVTSKRGSIGEEGAWVGQPDMAYSSSKTALNAVTVHYARELASTPIKVNGAAPGHVATDFNGFRGLRTPEQGAAVAVRLATLPADGPTGTVFEDDLQLAW
jgi:NAD(P)-dependent dehydrogenase (short-subunit alcohol dehydrogenase family)